MKLLLLVGLGCVILACCVAQSPAPSPTAAADSAGGDVPYCDEVDTHPSTTGLPNEDIPTDDIGNDNSPIPNAQEYAGQLAQIANQLQNGHANASAMRFAEMSARQLARMNTLLKNLRSRQKEIDELFSMTLPSIETSIRSRRSRAQVVREELRAMNEKLRKLVDSLDRSTYVQEQQAYMTIIDILTRIQNSIEMKMLNTEKAYSPVRPTETHPMALIQDEKSATVASEQQQQQQLVEVSKPQVAAESVADHKELVSNVPAKEEASPDAEMLNALDLLEVGSEQVTLPYQRRMNLLLKRIQTVLSRLIGKFSEMRQKHKEYAKSNREVWGKQIDVLQQQSDDLSANLEEVTEQTHFYIKVYYQHTDQLRTLISEQEKTMQAYTQAKQELLATGQAFHTESQLRASQLRKIQELNHYLLQPNQTYNEAVFAFACDGVIGGSAVVDGCGVCGGSNVTCQDCSGKVQGVDEVDICGDCAGLGRSCSYFCAGGPDSGILVDLCGECGGNGTICLGCDGVPHSGLVYDSCGVCGGDGSTCSRDNAPQKIQLAVAGANELLVITKLRFSGVALTPDWTSKNGDAIRRVMASVTQVDVSKVYLMLAEGSDSVVVSVGVGVAASEGNNLKAQITHSIADTSFATALSKEGAHISAVVMDASKNNLEIVQGPAIVQSPTLASSN